MNSLGQPIGEALPNWTPRPLPSGTPLSGRYCRLERLEARHGEQLYAAAAQDDASAFTYLFYGPFKDLGEFDEWLRGACASQDPLYYAIIESASGTVVGFASFLRMEPRVGVIEVGNVYFSRRLRQTPAATEAMYLMMRYAFVDLGYRRYEWKCDSLNAPSRKAADRLGFIFEGIFRQAVIYKGRNRDTAWFSVIDKEWPKVGRALEEWLDPANFDAGRQRKSLAGLRGS
ncbi:MAG: GNAT family protein [Vulcanimicrobiaceae bacterium]|jgi:RimJ/RimL family protein N-acetyltransferase